MEAAFCTFEHLNPIFQFFGRQMETFIFIAVITALLETLILLTFVDGLRIGNTMPGNHDDSYALANSAIEVITYLKYALLLSIICASIGFWKLRIPAMLYKLRSTSEPKDGHRSGHSGLN